MACVGGGAAVSERHGAWLGECVLSDLAKICGQIISMTSRLTFPVLFFCLSVFFRLPGLRRTFGPLRRDGHWGLRWVTAGIGMLCGNNF